MFETYGAEQDFVYATDYHYVWTYVDGDEGTYLVSGRAFVNRIGYIITEVPWEDDKDITITISLDSERDGYEEEEDLEDE
jgi:hypothetical protein